MSWMRTALWGAACASSKSLPTSRTPLLLQRRTHCHRLPASGDAHSSPLPAPPDLPGLAAPQTLVKPCQMKLYKKVVTHGQLHDLLEGYPVISSHMALLLSLPEGHQSKSGNPGRQQRTWCCAQWCDQLSLLHWASLWMPSQAAIPLPPAPPYLPSTPTHCSRQGHLLNGPTPWRLLRLPGRRPT